MTGKHFDPCPDCEGEGVDDDGDDCQTCEGTGEVEDESSENGEDRSPAVTEPPR